jgi:RHS repeat-associated protein
VRQRSPFAYNQTPLPSAALSTSKTKNGAGVFLARGNQNLTWDYDNRVSALTGGGFVNSKYDYAGIRVQKDSNLGTTLFPFDGYRIEPGGTIVKNIRIGIETVAVKKSTGQKLFFHNDHLGGVNVITRADSVVDQLVEYGPWGKTSRLQAGGEGLLRFTGQQQDIESGLLYYGGRYYDPDLGRFISPDPFVPEILDPQSHNRYSYVLNNPVGNIDPSGYFHRHHGGGGFFSSIFGSIFRIFFSIVTIAMGLPPIAEVANFAMVAFGLTSLGLAARDLANATPGGDGTGSPGGILSIPGLSNAGGGGYFSPSLTMLARAGCDICSDSGWDLLRSIIGTAQAASTKPRRAPQPDDPGMEGPIDARLTNYSWTGRRTASGDWPTEGDRSFDNPSTLAVAGQMINGRLQRKPYSIPFGTKIFIEGYGWGIVKDICPECTPGHPNYAGVVLGRGVNQSFGEVRIDVFGPMDLGVRQIWLYRLPQ